MKILITGAAGNLGTFLSHHLHHSDHHLNLMVHQTPISEKLSTAENMTVIHADLGEPETLPAALHEVDVVVHFAGRLFAPRPATFLPETNVAYVRNLVEAASSASVEKFILISFPHVEGESTPQEPAQGYLQGNPQSLHAQTRLAAEKQLFTIAANSNMTAIVLRPGMIYARGVLMIDTARWLLEHHLLGVWPDPTWIHLISLPDFLAATTAAIETPPVRGIYNLADDMPITLQNFLDRVAVHWSCSKPWRAPAPLFYLAAAMVEAYAAMFRTPAPLTRDFIRIGRASYCADTSRMKAELLPSLEYPDLGAGMVLL
ncbi:MAG: NAD-dependent epimerase/dehydratase family protein [Anaerolineales bacterium]|jgi:nucleoside-diphosphate-sugar epimerase